MDSFVDKLAQRFNAGELIKANGEAEALEANRMKAQAGEYVKAIQEMRRLNLKTVELSEQITQMIQCSMEQLEAYDVHFQKEDEKKQDDILTALKAVESGMEEQLDAIRDMNEKQMLFLQENAKNQLEMIQTSSQNQAENFGEILRQHKLAVEETSQQQSLALSENMARQREILNEGLVSQQETVHKIEERLTTLRAAIEESLTDMETSLRSGTKDYEPILQTMHINIGGNKAFYDERSSQLMEALAKLDRLLAEQQKQMLDFVHKENVKVYRNVQAVVNDQTAMKAQELSDRIAAVEKRTGKYNFLIVLTFLCAAASLAMQILQMLGML